MAPVRGQAMWLVCAIRWKRDQTFLEAGSFQEGDSFVVAASAALFSPGASASHAAEAATTNSRSDANDASAARGPWASIG